MRGAISEFEPRSGSVDQGSGSGFHGGPNNPIAVLVCFKREKAPIVHFLIHMFHRMMASHDASCWFGMNFLFFLLSLLLL